ncbi:YIP1 family protein [Priestia megaterium]|uniref:YIP1 family protein n=1 Tax=Priestia megaterium TaxID=1404 RepID=UPI00211D1040|nr:YIP1 family protein [Priestia megaterium]MDH3161174.1 YIP1 family protein [Priestia megaterium]MED4117245.1 YIP1 family protein [Priestia megaterium]
MLNESEVMEKREPISISTTNPISLVKVLLNPITFFSKLKTERKLGINIFIILALYGIVTFFLSQYLLTNNEISSSLPKELQNEKSQLIMVIGTTLVGIFQFVFTVLVSTLLYKIILFFAQIRVTFKGLFHIVMVAQIPLIIGKIINLIFINQDTVNMPITSLGFTIKPFTDSSFLLNFFSNVEIFSIWSYFIIALGTSVCIGVSRKKSMLIVFSTWLIFLTLSSVLIGFFN